MKVLLTFFSLLFFSVGLAQDKEKRPIYVGASYISSAPTTWNSLLGIGLHGEVTLRQSEVFRFSTRAQLHAVASGVFIMPTGIEEFREGGNLALINSLMLDKMLRKRGHNQLYVGLEASLVTQHRHFTIRKPGDWVTRQKWVFVPAAGPRVGIITGRVDLSASFSVIKDTFLSFGRFGLSYRIR